MHGNAREGRDADGTWHVVNVHIWPNFRIPSPDCNDECIYWDGGSKKIEAWKMEHLENVANLLTVTQPRLPHLRQTTAPSVNTTRSAGYYAFVRLNWSHPMISNLLMTLSRKTLMKAQEPRRGGYIILIFYFGTVTVMLIQQLEVTKLVRVRVIWEVVVD